MPLFCKIIVCAILILFILLKVFCLNIERGVDNPAPIKTVVKKQIIPLIVGILLLVTIKGW